MKNKINKLQTLSIIKNAKNVESYVEYENNYFTIDLKGEIVPKQDQHITLQKIYELVIVLNQKIVNLETKTNQRFDKLETEMKKRMNKIEKEIKILKQLPTIAKELKGL